MQSTAQSSLPGRNCICCGKTKRCRGKILTRKPSGILSDSSSPQRGKQANKRLAHARDIVKCYWTALAAGSSAPSRLCHFAVFYFNKLTFPLTCTLMLTCTHESLSHSQNEWIELWLNAEQSLPCSSLCRPMKRNPDDRDVHYKI